MARGASLQEGPDLFSYICGLEVLFTDKSSCAPNKIRQYIIVKAAAYNIASEVLYFRHMIKFLCACPLRNTFVPCLHCMWIFSGFSKFPYQIIFFSFNNNKCLTGIIMNLISSWFSESNIIFYMRKLPI